MPGLISPLHLTPSTVRSVAVMRRESIHEPLKLLPEEDFLEEPLTWVFEWRQKCSQSNGSFSEWDQVFLIAPLFRELHLEGTDQIIRRRPRCVASYLPLFLFFLFFPVVCIFLVLAHRIAAEVMMPHINALALSRISCKSLCSVWSFPDGDAHIQRYINIYILKRKPCSFCRQLSCKGIDTRRQTFRMATSLALSHANSVQSGRREWENAFSQAGFRYTEPETKGRIAGDGFNSPFL